LVEEYFDGKTLRAALQEAELCLEDHIEELNLLNVFPVPDGDTGINMFITLKSANEAVANINTDSAATVSAVAARGALLGASGNSGVILSQILRGIAKGMEMKERFSCIHFAESLQTAAEMARRAVTNPVEGTIITVSREASEMAMRMAKKGATLKQTMKAIVLQSKRTVRRTPELLPELKEAGVVDAGGKGLFYFFQGMNNYVSKRMKKSRETEFITSARNISQQTADGYGFDLQFIVRGDKLPVLQIRRKIEKMGESVMVVGDEQLVRVHIHTVNPEEVLLFANKQGKVTDLLKQNMDEQVAAFNKKHGNNSANS
jgi:DAK2 domain fusion protein YloV